MIEYDEHMRSRATEGPVEVLPTLPPPGFDGGYDWMDELGGTPWHPISSWGRDGWDMGQWPYVIVSRCLALGDKVEGERRTRAWGFATYVEGDITVKAFATEDELLDELDATAHWYWRHTGNGPTGFADLPGWNGHAGPVEAKYCRPFTWARSDRGTD